MIKLTSSTMIKLASSTMIKLDIKHDQLECFYACTHQLTNPDETSSLKFVFFCSECPTYKDPSGYDPLKQTDVAVTFFNDSNQYTAVVRWETPPGSVTFTFPPGCYVIILVCKYCMCVCVRVCVCVTHLVNTII